MTRRVAGLLLGLALIGAWQHAVFRSYDYTLEYRLQASGNHDERRFVYFLYYLGLFPVASTKSGLDYGFYYGKDQVEPQPSTLVYSREAAEQVMAQEPDTLVTEWGHTIRTGNLLRTFLYLPHAWWRGSPESIELVFAHVLVFTAALMALFASFWWLRSAWLGLWLVLSIGSNPFQIYEMYYRDNIFGWPITTFCLVLAASAPLLGRRPLWRGYVWAAPVVTGLLLATTHQIRPENTVMALVAVFAYLTATTLRWRARAAMTALLCVTFLVGARAWEGWFDRKLDEANARVAAAGGHPYPGPRDRYHQLWHALWTGLGDFDRRYGFATGDHAAIAYAQPVLQARDGREMPWWWGVAGTYEQGRTASDYYDAAKRYYRLPWDTPHYYDVLRGHMLSTIARDPLWYADILRQRAWRVLRQTTPLEVRLPPLGTATLPFHGLLALPLVALAARARRWFVLKLLLLSAVPSLVAIAVTSAGNMPYAGVYHLCAAAVGVAWGGEAVRAWCARRARGLSAALPAGTMPARIG